MAINVAPINVPQTQPNPVQFQPPTDLVNSYLNRQQAGQFDVENRTQQLATALNTYNQQKIQRQLEGLKAVAELYGAGGRRAVNAYAPTINKVAGENIMPNLPPNAQDISGNQVAGQAPSSTPPVGGFGASNNAPATPQSRPDMLGDPSIINHGQSVGYDMQHPAYQTQATPPANPYQTPAGGMQVPQPSQEDVQDMLGGGTYGTKLGQAYKAAGDVAMMPMQAQKMKNELAMQPTEAAQKQTTLSNTQQQIPLEIGSKQAEQQTKYGAENEKYIRAAHAVKELNAAWEAVPNQYKGAYVGSVTANAGKGLGNIAPAVVDFNEKRKLALNELATAFLPESQRANPSEARKIDDALFSLQSTPGGKANSLKSVYSRIIDLEKQNANAHQTAASSFGGKITPNPIPYLQTATGPNGHKIGSNDGNSWFDIQTGQKIQ